ncbi:MAG: lipase maturation factor family protein, partial [Acidobacteriota bacterium]|nr:lipase maturation factor family protein [Acidobacteriota bacterium]
ILLTGNYTFFNWLTISLCLWLVIEPDRSLPRPLPHRAVSAALAGFIAFMSALLFLTLFGGPLPPAGGAILHAVDPLRLVNSYGLFAVMTTTRPEIVVEGSRDGETWLPYEFPFKPGDPARMPPLVAPYQPRLDWQMWFAALGTYQENGWFVNFMVRLLQGDRAVLALLKTNPFGGTPPKYVRARLFEYHFTRFGEKGWWRREEKGLYFPGVSLKP